MTDIGNDPATLPFATIGIDLHFNRLKLIVCNQNSGCGCGRWWLWWVGGPVIPVATPAALIDMSSRRSWLQMHAKRTARARHLIVS